MNKEAVREIIREILYSNGHPSFITNLTTFTIWNSYLPKFTMYSIKTQIHDFFDVPLDKEL